MSNLHLVITAPERHSLERPCEECGARAGIGCLRSGGAIVGRDSRFGVYVHQSRVDAWLRARPRAAT